MDEVYWQIGMTLADSEKKIILKCLRFNQGNQQKTADMLGISRKTVYNKLCEYGVIEPETIVEQLPTKPTVSKKQK